MRNKILVVDDEQSMRDFLSIMLEKEGHAARSASSAGEALRILDQERWFDLIISDIRMPDMDGLELLRRIKSINSEIPIILITAFASTETAIEALKLGAFDYVTKPFKVDELKLIIRKSLDHRALREEDAQLQRDGAEQSEFGGFVGQSEAMRRIFETIRKVAGLASSVLITGESGTGKELVARAIHYGGTRRERPFVAVNCGALPETLLESELFGHMRGSFTGAVDSKQGLFEVADKGTFFLDEVGETSPAIQVKLLRVLNDKKFKPIGGVRDREVDVRIIAATNQDLEEAVSEGRFRQDLYYRLNVIPIRIPPLRERRDDIPLLVDHFLGKYCKECDCAVKRISVPAMRLLREYHWPGNVRELENLIERTVALESRDMIVPESLPSPVRFSTQRRVFPTATLPLDGLDLQETLDAFERQIILAALDRTGGVKKEAAKLLRVTFRSLRYRIEKHGLDREGFVAEGDDSEDEYEGGSR